MENGGFLQTSMFYNYLIHFLPKFHETSWLYCLVKISPSALDFYLYVFNLTLCHGKSWFLVKCHGGLSAKKKKKGGGGLRAKFQFLLISHLAFVKISRNFMDTSILLIKCFNVYSCYF